MKILFCHYTYPGWFEPFLSSLASDPGNRVVFLSSYFRRGFSMPGVSLMQLRPWKPRNDGTEEGSLLVRESRRLIDIGHIAYQAYAEMRRAGFVPDIIFTSLSDGFGVFLRMAFPEAFIVSYFEDLRRVADDPADYGKSRVELFFRSAQMTNSNLNFVLAGWHRKLLPPLLRQTAKVMPYFADAEFFAPGEGGEGELVSFNMKSADPGIRGKYLPLVAGLLERRPGCRTVLLAGSRTIRQALEMEVRAFPEALRPRCEVADFLPVEDYRRVLQQSALHICPDAMEPPIREMLECLSCETLLMGPDGLSKFVLPLPAEDPLEAVCSILDHADGYAAHRKSGRRAVLRHRDRRRVIEAHIASVVQEYGSAHK